MSTFKQLIKEFSIPATLALVWTGYSLYESKDVQLSVKNFVDVFGPSFFFVSWLVAQWFRVKKQQGVERGLGTIEKNIQETLSKLEKTAVQLAGHITGGNSICYLHGPQPNGNIWTSLLIIHQGEHPLYDVAMRIFDVDKFELHKSNLNAVPASAYEQSHVIGNLIPNHARFFPLSLDLGGNSVKKFNIFFTARNGSFTQLMRCRMVNGVWLFATQVQLNNNVEFTKIDDGYLQTEEEIDWNS